MVAPDMSFDRKIQKQHEEVGVCKQVRRARVTGVRVTGVRVTGVRVTYGTVKDHG